MAAARTAKEAKELVERLQREVAALKAAQAKEQPTQQFFTPDERSQLSGKPGLNAQAALAERLIELVSSALAKANDPAVSVEGLIAMKSDLEQALEAARSHIKFIKVWLSQGPDVARKWAELTGLHGAAPCVFEDPKEQAALEQAIKACAKPSAAAADSGQQRKRARKGTDPSHARAALVCYTCGGNGHTAKECPSDGPAVQKLRPPQ